MQNLSFRTPRSVLIKTLSIFLFLCTLPTVAQEAIPSLTKIQNLTPEAQIKYVLEARKRGYSLAQLESLAKTQGANVENLSLIRDLWFQSQTDEASKAEQQSLNLEQATPFGNESEVFFSPEKKSDIFGSAFFANKNITETSRDRAISRLHSFSSRRKS